MGVQENDKDNSVATLHDVRDTIWCSDAESNHDLFFEIEVTHSFAARCREMKRVRYLNVLPLNYRCIVNWQREGFEPLWHY